jgi:hypothetical protein
VGLAELSSLVVLTVLVEEPPLLSAAGVLVVVPVPEEVAASGGEAPLLRVKPTLKPMMRARVATPNTPRRLNRLRRAEENLLGASCDDHGIVVRI